MLARLTAAGVGPIDPLDLEFGQRLNLITGDNSLGKSFILDLAWFVMTRSWVGQQALPRSQTTKAELHYTFQALQAVANNHIWFDFQTRWRWIFPPGQPPNPGLVIYARVDGGFAVYDPYRLNPIYSIKRGPTENPEQAETAGLFENDAGLDHPLAIFTQSEVLNGKPLDPKKPGVGWLCEGLYRDLRYWKGEGGPEFDAMQKVIASMSPPGEDIRFGPFTSISPTDSQDYPSIIMQGRDPVPLPHASAAIRRIVCLAYMLVWSWRAHKKAAEQRRIFTRLQVTFLFDEIESHLHPRWQRSILKSLMELPNSLSQGEAESVQLIATTHSPLVMASAEDFFSDTTDRWIDLNMATDGTITAEAEVFAACGTADAWLQSPAFDLGGAGSLKREELTRKIDRVMNSPPDQAAYRALDHELKQHLPGDDNLFPTWRYFGIRNGWIDDQA